MVSSLGVLAYSSYTLLSFSWQTSRALAHRVLIVLLRFHVPSSLCCAAHGRALRLDPEGIFFPLSGRCVFRARCRDAPPFCIKLLTAGDNQSYARCDTRHVRNSAFAFPSSPSPPLARCPIFLADIRRVQLFDTDTYSILTTIPVTSPFLIAPIRAITRTVVPHGSLCFLLSFLPFNYTKGVERPREIAA